MRKIINLLLLLIVCSVSGQNYKFGKITKEELQETSNPTDPEAHASILYAKEKVYFQYVQGQGFFVVTEVQKRIKIYDKEGARYATEFVPFYNLDNEEREILNNLKGYTYYLKDGKVEKDKLDKESIFKEKTNKNWSQLKFTMPNISDGCIIEFQYRKESPYVYIDPVVLQYDIPVKKMEVDLRIPEYFHFNKYVNPKAKYYPEIKEFEENRTQTIIQKKSTTDEAFFNEYIIDNEVRSKTSTSELSFKEKVYVVNLDNVPALKQEPFVDNMNVYRCKIDWEYAMYNGPDGAIKSYATDWGSVAKMIYEFDEFGGQLSKTGYFEKDIDVLIANESNVSKRITLIYNYVKSKVAWNEYYGEYAEKGVRKAFKEGSGNVADINLMLTAMLRYAGLNSSPVLISTKRNGIPMFPTLIGFNYVIAAVELPDQIILLDATDRRAMPNILPSRAVNWKGRLIREQGSSEWIDLMHPEYEVKNYMLQAELQNDLTVTGRVRILEKNVAAMKFRKKYSNMAIDERIQELEQDKGEIEISDYKVKNEEHLNNPALQYSYSFKLNDAVDVVDDKLYVSPMLFLATTENVFKQDDREYPMEFTYPQKISYNITMFLPEGYSIESLPESAQANFNQTEGVYKYLITKTGDKIVVKVDLDIHEPFVTASHYKDFRAFIGMQVQKETEKIILKKEVIQSP